MNKSILAVNEMFGPTFQGEGIHLGSPCYFIRLAGCNLACRWCDTPYAWDWKGKNGRAYDPTQEIHPTKVVDLVADLTYKRKQSGISHLVITGGEPLLQTAAFGELLSLLQMHGLWFTEVETAGTINPDTIDARLSRLVGQFNVSLKLEGSGNPKEKRYNPDAVEWFANHPRAYFKFVITSPKDLDEADELVNIHGVPASRVILMPEGISPEAIQEHGQLAAQFAIKRGWRMTTRLQILLYGVKRGV